MLNTLGMKARTVVTELQDGTVCKMDFDLGALAHAEGVYEEQFGRVAGIHDIIGELVQGRARALMAIAYGAMLSAGEDLTWERFAKGIYTFENYDRLSKAVSDAVVAMMRGGDDDIDEGDEKNAPSRGGR